MAIHAENPDTYEGYGNANAGKIMSIIGLALSILFIIYVVWMISYIGIDVLKNPELLQEKMQEMQNR